MIQPRLAHNHSHTDSFGFNYPTSSTSEKPTSCGSTHHRLNREITTTSSIYSISSTDSPAYTTSSMESSTSSSMDTTTSSTFFHIIFGFHTPPTYLTSTTTTEESSSSTDSSFPQAQKPLQHTLTFFSSSTSDETTTSPILLQLFHRLSNLLQLLYGINYLFKYGHNPFFSFSTSSLDSTTSPTDITSTTTTEDSSSSTYSSSSAPAPLRKHHVFNLLQLFHRLSILPYSSMESTTSSNADTTTSSSLFTSSLESTTSPTDITSTTTTEDSTSSTYSSSSIETSSTLSNLLYHNILGFHQFYNLPPLNLPPTDDSTSLYLLKLSHRNLFKLTPAPLWSPPFLLLFKAPHGFNFQSTTSPTDSSVDSTTSLAPSTLLYGINYLFKDGHNHFFKLFHIILGFDHFSNLPHLNYHY
ncbi:uncharacterized serine-rich protein C215.13-like [Penaeus monodon]|uniref:uncharacterized serine-rich protein C215.13-like n=1 Tax=Penaeus monodon TaxID=6687 RepID=UPI0018A78E90|nr:uncharacterized serine-rich protein C215.13-like [Penaeus monodon]